MKEAVRYGEPIPDGDVSGNDCQAFTLKVLVPITTM